MTTLAYCGRYLAADSLSTAGHVKMGPRTKIEVQTTTSGPGGYQGPVAFAITGHHVLFPRLIQWWIEGADPNRGVKGWHGPATDDSCFIVARPGIVEYCWGDAPHLTPAHAPDHWGSGGEHAHAAMLAGMTAPEAVAISTMMDTHSGGDILYVDLLAPAWEVITVPEAAVREWQGQTANYRRFMPLPEAWVGRREPEQWDIPYHIAMNEPPERTRQRHALYEKARLWPTKAPHYDLYTDRCGACGWNFRDGEHPPLPQMRENAKRADWDCTLCQDLVREADSAIMLTITKPSRETKGDGNESWRYPECDGRLVEATGCGHCLRCNREWYALLRQMQAPSDATAISFTAADLERVGRKTAPGQLRAQLEASVDIERESNLTPDKIENMRRLAVLNAWVRQWNDAAAIDLKAVLRQLEVQLRGMQFPDGVYLVDEVITNPATGQPYTDRVGKKVVDATGEASNGKA